MEKFAALGLSENVLEALAKKGFETPTEIQEKTIPLLLKGNKDIVGQAATGTGKTAAFGLPLIEQLDDSNRNVQALIMCPTRELAIQVGEEIMTFKNNKKLFMQPIYGGQSYNVQISALKRGVQIVVGTPGRIRDHIEKGTLKLNHVTHVVLDEADEMLNMGFEEEVKEILKSVPTERRMLLFSATMPPNILRLAKTFMREYDVVEVKKSQTTTENVDQQYFEVRDSDRFATLCRIIDTEPEFYGIIFCRTKNETDQIADKLLDRGYDAEGIHGDVTQSQREIILKKFKMKKLNILVATDVAARGIDVNDLTHVINFNLPQDPEAYIHRIGRTGRAGKTGTAITIISPKEMRDLMFIQKIAGSKIRKEEVPTIEDVVETKKMKLKTDIQSIVDKGDHKVYANLAKELLEENPDADKLIAGLLRFSMKDNLREDSYQEISDVSSRGGNDNSMVRLFVAKGHEDNMNAGKVADFLSQETGVNPEALHDIRVFDRFSFITAPFAEAEQILAIFGKSKNGRPMVTKAKDKDSGGGGNGGGRSSYGGGNSRGGGGGSRNGGGSFREKRNEGGNRDGGSRGGERKEFKPREKSESRSFERRDSKPSERNAAPRNREDRKPAPRRENKLTNYLDAPKKDFPIKEKAPKKEEGSFKISTSDNDLSW